MFGRRINKVDEEKIKQDFEKKERLRELNALKKEMKANRNPSQAVIDNIKQAGSKPVDFSTEQKMLQELFGHGSKIWGIENEPVKINRTLYSGETETGALFGFGNTKPVKNNDTARLFF